MQNLTPLINWLQENERTQSWLTGKLNIHRNEFTYWKQGKIISLQHLQKIEEITGISPNQINEEGK
jgi:sugar diacid utilization regulator